MSSVVYEVNSIAVVPPKHNRLLKLLKVTARFTCVLYLLAPFTAPGDGKMIPQHALERVQIPDQRALIHFADGIETLVIDTSFHGNGTNFAWIIPVPSVPTVEPATTGLFTTLQILFQPTVTHSVARYWIFIIIVGIVIAWALWRIRYGEPVLIPIFLFAFAVVILSSMLLPALGKAKAGGDGSTEGGVNVVNRKRVGIYDTATLFSTDGDAVFRWLEQNGFATPTNIIPAIRDYAGEGWHFVASKLHLDTPSAEAAKAHPLSLKFKTERAVYPLRLTGIDNEPCRIELYVFGPERAGAASFRVKTCTQPVYPAPDQIFSRYRQYVQLRIRHPLLRDIVKNSAVATQLTGELSSRQMRKDAYIDWKSFKEKKPLLYSFDAARTVAMNMGALLLVGGVICLLRGHWAQQDGWPHATRLQNVSLTLIAASVMAGAAIYFLLPKTEVILTRRFDASRVEGFHGDMAWNLATDAKALETTGTSQDVDWVRKQIAANSAQRMLSFKSDQPTNTLTGQLLREEDSPGNYVIRESSNVVYYLWFDMDGREEAVPLFKKSN